MSSSKYVDDRDSIRCHLQRINIDIFEYIFNNLNIFFKLCKDKSIDNIRCCLVGGIPWESLGIGIQFLNIPMFGWI